MKMNKFALLSQSVKYEEEEDQPVPRVRNVAPLPLLRAKVRALPRPLSPWAVVHRQ